MYIFTNDAHYPASVTDHLFSLMLSFPSGIVVDERLEFQLQSVPLTNLLIAGSLIDKGVEMRLGLISQTGIFPKKIG